jgi:hypothetical protein
MITAFNVLACPVAVLDCGAAILSAICMDLLGLPYLISLGGRIK